MRDDRPTLRVIHHLQRTGGTLIARCIASLPSVALLSEVHPKSPKELIPHDPCFQACFWLKLMGFGDASGLQQREFSEQIAEIGRLAALRGEVLVLRNWAYLDYFGHPWASPTMDRMQLIEALSESFRLVEVVSVRHPLQQWYSWSRYPPEFHPPNETLESFLQRCRAFQTATAGKPIVRYEDFAQAPRPTLKVLCRHLELEFDPTFSERWYLYRNVTGLDSHSNLVQGRITLPEPYEVDGATLRAADQSETYADLLAPWGYDQI